MSTFICEKCGKLDNSACNNNYWHAIGNKYRKSKGEKLDICFKPQFIFFEDHICCSDCYEEIIDNKYTETLHSKKTNIKNKEHWTKYGKEKLLEWEKRKDGSMVNATEYFKNNNI